MPCFNYTFHYSSNIVNWFANHVDSNVLSNISEKSCVSASIILFCAWSSVKAGNVSKVFIPPHRRHTSCRCISRKFSLCKFISMLVVQLDDELLVNDGHWNNLGIFATLWRKLLLESKRIKKLTDVSSISQFTKSYQVVITRCVC